MSKLLINPPSSDQNVPPFLPLLLDAVAIPFSFKLPPILSLFTTTLLSSIVQVPCRLPKYTTIGPIVNSNALNLYI